MEFIEYIIDPPSELLAESHQRWIHIVCSSGNENPLGDTSGSSSFIHYNQHKPASPSSQQTVWFLLVVTWDYMGNRRAKQGKCLDQATSSMWGSAKFCLSGSKMLCNNVAQEISPNGQEKKRPLKNGGWVRITLFKMPSQCTTLMSTPKKYAEVQWNILLPLWFILLPSTTYCCHI